MKRFLGLPLLILVVVSFQAVNLAHAQGGPPPQVPSTPPGPPTVPTPPASPPGPPPSAPTPAKPATPAPTPQPRALAVNFQADQGNPDAKVWVNTASGVYHCPGTRWYGTTKQGEYMTQAEAQKKGFRPAYGKVCR